MTVNIICRIPAKKSGVKAVPFELPAEPSSLRELVRMCVISCIGAYDREKRKEEPIPEQRFREMEYTGKFAFGYDGERSAADPGKAVSDALEAIRDGVVRVFSGDTELTDPDGELHVKDGDTFTFIRLTMLTGRMW